MIHDETCDLSCICDIHCICDMTLTCNGTLHCVCMGTSHSIGVSAWLESKPHLVINKRLGTVGPNSTESHGRMTWKTCV